MRQVLFRLPIPTPWTSDIPIYGFGAMLVIALFLCTWLAGRRAQKVGIAKEHVQDLAFWVVIAGIVGARVVFMVQYHVPWTRFLYFWEGGLVFYGALIGGVVGYVLGYWFILRKHKIASWKLGDAIAPSIALGLALGRVGCLLNGCCYGHVACPGTPGIHFPVRSLSGGLGEPKGLVPEGYQALAGFTMSGDPGADPRTVGAVDASSSAAGAGLRPGDVIVKADGHDIPDYSKLVLYLVSPDSNCWNDGKTSLTLTVLRDGKPVDLTFTPRTLGLNPTQPYETVSMLLLFGLLLAYTPFKRHDGEVFFLFLLCYPVHRFLNEMLRNDTDPVAFGMTLSQNGSILAFLVAVGLWVWVLRKPAQYHPFKEAAALEPAATSA